MSEVTIDTDSELLFPDHYINAVTERLALYRELSELHTQEELSAFESRLIDRFGPLPEEAQGLLQSILLKERAKSLGLEKVVYKRETLLGYFIADGQSSFFQSSAFQTILKKSATLDCQLKEKTTKAGPTLLIRFDKIPSMTAAIEALESLKE